MKTHSLRLPYGLVVAQQQPRHKGHHVSFIFNVSILADVLQGQRYGQGGHPAQLHAFASDRQRLGGVHLAQQRYGIGPHSAGDVFFLFLAALDEVGANWKEKTG